MTRTTRTSAPHSCDVAVIGAGVVGCAVARRFALAGASVVVVERGADILSGASKANSAILHTGFDAPPGSLELDLVKAGREEYLSIHRDLGLSIVKTGAATARTSSTLTKSRPRRSAWARAARASASEARGEAPHSAAGLARVWRAS